MQQRATAERFTALSATRRLWYLHGRLAISIAFGLIIAGCTVAVPARLASRVLIGWDSGVLLYLFLVARLFSRSTIQRIKHRAGVYDEGVAVILVLTTAASVASLAAVLAELTHAPSAQGISVWFDASIGMATITLSWLFLHTIFALHYAHEYYGEGRYLQIGGLDFPGEDAPDYWDFLYYSLVIAMTAQVSDVQITSRVIRWQTTVHAVVAFFFNVAILALSVNIASNLVQNDR